MSRWQLRASTVTIVPFSDNISSSLGTAVISLDFASVAIWARTRRWSQPQAVTMCSADLPLAASKERRSVDRDDALGGFGEPRHEALKAGAELVGIEPTQDPAERDVARRAMLQGQKTAQERFLVLGELGHRALPATQNRAQRNHQDFQQIMPTGIAAARIFQPFKAGDEPVHFSSSTHRIQNAVGRLDRKPTRKLKCSCQTVSNAIPLRIGVSVIS